jgi:hypothetical protein
MDPASSSGRFTALSDLDYAALEDIGWVVSPPSRFQFADFTNGAEGTLTGPSGAIPLPAVPEFFVDGASGTATVTVTRVGPVDEPASVHYETFDGIANSLHFSPTAVAGTNYTPVSGVLTFAPGETTKTFAVPVTDDHSGLPAAVGLALGDPSPGSLLGSLAAATLIIRSQPPPPPTVVNSSSTVVNSSSTIVNSPPTVVTLPPTLVTSPPTVVTSSQTVVPSPPTKVPSPSTLVTQPLPGLAHRHAHPHSTQLKHHIHASGHVGHLARK